MEVQAEIDTDEGEVVSPSESLLYEEEDEGVSQEVAEFQENPDDEDQEYEFEGTLVQEEQEVAE